MSALGGQCHFGGKLMVSLVNSHIDAAAALRPAALRPGEKRCACGLWEPLGMSALGGKFHLESCQCDSESPGNF